MKILYITDHLRGGGAEQQFAHIVNNIPAEKYIYLTEDKGIRLKTVNNDIPVSGGHGKRRLPKSIREIKEIIEDFKPDIVHSFLMYSCLVCALAIKISKIKPFFICQEFSSPEQILREVKFYHFKKFLIRMTYKMADMLITSSNEVKKEIIQEKYAHFSKTKVIAEGIELSKFSTLHSKEELKTKLKLCQNCVYFIYVGSLVGRKGVKYLIRAFNKINDDGLRLLIVGEGREKIELEKIAAGNPRIEFLGYKENAIEYIKASDVFVLPSMYEGLPNVIIEAMAVGMAVIATNVYGIKDLIKNMVNGLLITAKDTDELKCAMETMLNDYQMRKIFADKSLRNVRYL